MPLNSSIETNGRRYEAPKNCAVVICLDGCEPEYLEVAIEQGLMPNLDRIRRTGTSRIAHSVIPSFTNPNNISIATGRPPSIHGICGNYLYEPETGEEVMMNDVRFLRAPTIFSHYYKAGHGSRSSPPKTSSVPFSAPACPLTTTARSASRQSAPTRQQGKRTASRMRVLGLASPCPRSIPPNCRSSSSLLASSFLLSGAPT